MKRLIVGLVLLSLPLLAAHAKADGASFELQKAWDAQQAQKEKIAGERCPGSKETPPEPSAALLCL